jgi:hypothetical protein
MSEYIRQFQNAFDSDRNDSDWLEGRADLFKAHAATDATAANGLVHLT